MLSNLIQAAIRTQKPFWFEGPTLFKNETINFGRLGLPGENGGKEALLIIYFQVEPILGPDGESPGENAENEIFWLD